MAQYITNIVVTGKVVTFYNGVAGNSWTVQLRNSAGNVLATTSGTSYGTFQITMPDSAPSGTYTLWCIPDYLNAEQNGTNFTYTAPGSGSGVSGMLAAAGLAAAAYILLKGVK